MVPEGKLGQVIKKEEIKTSVPGHVLGLLPISPPMSPIVKPLRRG